MQLGVEAAHGALAALPLEVLEKVARRLVAGVPAAAVGAGLPVRGHVAAAQAHPVGDALDQAALAGTVAVELEAVDELVGDDAVELVGDALGALVVNVPRGEVDLLVVVVEVAAGREGHAVHVAQDQGDGARRRQRAGRARRVLVQVAQDVVGAAAHALAKVDGREGAQHALALEVADLEAQRGQLEVAFVRGRRGRRLPQVLRDRGGSGRRAHDVEKRPGIGQGMASVWCCWW